MPYTVAFVLADTMGGHHRRVRHPQALDAAHAQVGVDDRQVVRPHPAGTDLVGIGAQTPAQVLPHALLVPHVGAGECLPVAPGREGVRRSDPSGDTRPLSSSDNRAAITQPAVPAPTMMKS